MMPMSDLDASWRDHSQPVWLSRFSRWQFIVYCVTELLCVMCCVPAGY